jgi:hypothetical protein
MPFGKELTVICLLACISCSAQSAKTPAITSSNQRGHGTIVVIVAAKNGYALAADSQLTVEDAKRKILDKRYDGQKLFPVGKFTACVVAGNVSSSARGDGFVLEGSVAREMASTDQILARNSRLAENMDAREFATFFQGRLLIVILGLLDADVTILQNPVFGMSVVSFRPDGRRQWVSYYQNFATETDSAGRKYFSPGDVIPIPEPASKVVAIGAPSAMVDSLISLDGPTNAVPFTGTPIMRRYFELKKAGRLDDLSLFEAEQLASGLVEDTVNRAPEEAGVHGPIDVATLSSEGFRWIAQKQNVAPLTPMFRSRYTNYFAEDGGPLSLDGFECVRCTFRNQPFTFEGRGDFRLVQPIFRDECKVTLDADAKAKMPQAVEEIRHVMGDHCKIVEASAGSAQ